MTRRFLFLQGPPGPFFRQLAATLRRRGHEVRHVSFNGGDLLDWRGRSIAFRGGIAEWPAELAAITEQLGITDIILFGDCRPLHRAAIAFARERAVQVHVFEEGYIRPDWITLEQGGVNGHSSLPREPHVFHAEAALLPPFEQPPSLPHSFARRAFEAVSYYFSAWLLTPFYPFYKSHRPSSAAETVGWLQRLSRRSRARRQAHLTLLWLAERSFFILPLQLDTDAQIVVHSPFGSMLGPIELVLDSFARAAPAGVRLVIKMHPLDNGIRDWPRVIAAEAARRGLAGRIGFLESGDVAAIVRRSCGVVTVNSTTGTFALAAGVPVKTLGTAVYDLPGITDQRPLDAFWRNPVPPCPMLFEAFRRVLVDRALLHGGFSSRAGRRALVEPAADRIMAARRQVPPALTLAAAA